MRSAPIFMGKLFNNKEKAFFDARSLEVLELVSTECPVLWKWALRVGNAVSGYVDCLYQEPIEGSKHYIPFDVLCYYEEKDRSTDVSEEGMVQVTDGRITFSRKNLEDQKVPLDEQRNHVSEGDIIQMWSQNKLRTWYFEIVSTNRSGWQLDSDNFTLYVCDVRRHESFTPERKIEK